MATVNRKRLEYACQAFLTQMARSFASEQPGEPSPVRVITDYSPEQRSMLMKAVGAAIKSTQADADQAFQGWLDRQMSDQ